MSQDAVFAFIHQSDSDPALQAALSEANGRDAVVRLAAEHGYDFTDADLDPVLSLLTFLQDVRQDAALRDELGDAADVTAVVDLAAGAGYRFSADQLAYLEFEELSADERLSDSDLEAVAGGVDGVQPNNTGLRVVIGQTPSRQTPKTDFGTMMKQGLSKTGDVSLAGAQLAAPFVPGGAVLSAAAGSVGGLEDTDGG